MNRILSATRFNRGILRSSRRNYALFSLVSASDMFGEQKASAGSVNYLMEKIKNLNQRVSNIDAKIKDNESKTNMVQFMLAKSILLNDKTHVIQYLQGQKNLATAKLMQEIIPNTASVVLDYVENHNQGFEKLQISDKELCCISRNELYTALEKNKELSIKMLSYKTVLTDSPEKVSDQLLTSEKVLEKISTPAYIYNYMSESNMRLCSHLPLLVPQMPKREANRFVFSHDEIMDLLLKNKKQVLIELECTKGFAGIYASDKRKRLATIRAREREYNSGIDELSLPTKNKNEIKITVDELAYLTDYSWHVDTYRFIPK